MKIVKALSLILISVFILNSCKKNTADDTNQEPLPNDAETVVASVTGIVVNENDLPVPGAIVSLGTQNTVTDNYGMFRFQKTTISKNNGYVKVTKAGYFNGNRNFITTAGRTHNVRIKLLPKTITGSFSSSAGGTITLSTGGKVIFPVNAIADAGGNAYSGTVNVSMVWINPTASDLASIMQGDLRGITTDGNERVLQTYGMLGVELTDAAGQKLKIATGKTAQISLPIPTALQVTAPASIPLWYYDEIKGRWMQEGSATKTGNNYVGDVSHFTFWNCDLPGPLVTICVNVKNQNNQPLNNVTVRIRRVNNPASVGYGVTDSLGNVCGAVPKNEALVLEILDNVCGNVVYTQNIGPFATNSSISVTATLSPTTMFAVSGTVVNCNNTPVTNGYVYIYTSAGAYINTPIINGSFSGSIIGCAGANNTFYAVIFDSANQQQNNIPASVVSNNGIVNFGQLSSCNNASGEFITLMIDNTIYTWSAPADTISCINAGNISGFSYGVRVRSTKIINGGTLSCDLIIYYNGASPQGGLSGYLTVPGLGLAAKTSYFFINITEAGPVNSGYVSGNFTNVQWIFNPCCVKTVNCSFRVRRIL